MSDHYKILGQSSTTVTSGVLTLYEVPSPSASDSYGPTVSPKAVSLLTRALVSTIVVVNTNGTIGTIDIGIVGNRIPGLTSIFDGLDGRVARLTGTQSSFGAEFDSLSDMVSFGMAPALIVFSWALSSLGNMGWAASFIFMSCAALRLARFNVQLGTVDKRFFVGLQSPIAAGVVTFLVWVGFKYGIEVTPVITAATINGIIVIFRALRNMSPSHFMASMDSPKNQPDNMPAKAPAKIAQSR